MPAPRIQVRRKAGSPPPPKAGPRQPDPRIAVYAGSFDPITNGHLSIVLEGSRLFKELIVAIGTNSEKKYTFSADERVAMVRACCSKIKNVEVDRFTDRFLVDYARQRGAAYIVRGIRNPEDYEYERAMRNINSDLAPDIVTIFIMPPRDLAEISSSFVKGLVGPQGWQRTVKKFLPAEIYKDFVTHMQQ
ncbi:MAG: pantetheine-phosphate adenylyltransferase [Planctomycetota bacterium]